MYAVIATGGKQYRVQEGDALKVELLHKDQGDTLEISDVLMVEKDGEIKVGNPTVEGARVTLKVLHNGRGKKITVFKFKAKKNYRRKKGHRQPFTSVLVEKIEV